MKIQRCIVSNLKVKHWKVYCYTKHQGCKVGLSPVTRAVKPEPSIPSVTSSAVEEDVKPDGPFLSNSLIFHFLSFFLLQYPLFPLFSCILYCLVVKSLLLESNYIIKTRWQELELEIMSTNKDFRVGGNSWS